MAELDRTEICARIKQAMKQAGLTQEELADLLGVSKRAVQTWESLKDPRVPWDRMEEIANVTGVTKVWLLHGDEEIVSPASLGTSLATVVRGLTQAGAALEVAAARLEAAADRLDDRRQAQGG